MLQSFSQVQNTEYIRENKAKISVLEDTENKLVAAKGKGMEVG